MKDSWKITILDIVAIITIPLIGIIGYQNDAKQQSIIDGQKATNETLKEVVKTLSVYSVRFENHEGRISNNTSEIKENHDSTTENYRRIIILERNK
ncbi:hypothetical protein KA005_01750 [bacterium]|nr:hypothetical protein [bacterium]